MKDRGDAVNTASDIDNNVLQESFSVELHDTIREILQEYKKDRSCMIFSVKVHSVHDWEALKRAEATRTRFVALYNDLFTEAETLVGLDYDN